MAAQLTATKASRAALSITGRTNFTCRLPGRPGLSSAMETCPECGAPVRGQAPLGVARVCGRQRVSAGLERPQRCARRRTLLVLDAGNMRRPIRRATVCSSRPVRASSAPGVLTGVFQLQRKVVRRQARGANRFLVSLRRYQLSENFPDATRWRVKPSAALCRCTRTASR